MVLDDLVVGPGDGSGVGEAEGASVSVGARVPKQSRNAKASTLPAPSLSCQFLRQESQAMLIKMTMR